MADKEIKKKSLFGNNLPLNRDQEIFDSNSVAAGDGYLVADASVGQVQVTAFNGHTATLQGTLDNINWITLTCRKEDGTEVATLDAAGLFNFTERLPLERIRVNLTGAGTGNMKVHAATKAY